MSWISVIDSSQFLATLYPDGDPSLESVRLHGVTLEQNGPSFRIRFDLNDFPSSPPRKWTPGSNRVQVTLLGVGVRQLSITGWTANNVGRLRIRRMDTGVRVDFVCAGASFDVELDHVRVDAVSAYRDESDGARAISG